MDISYYLLENPWPVAGLLFVAGILAAGVWFTRRRKAVLIVAGGLVVASVALVLAATLVLTDREQINDNLAAICRDAEQGRLDATQTYLDDRVGIGIPLVGKKELLGWARQALDSYHPRQIKLRNLNTLVAGLNATTTTGMLAELPEYGMINLDWRFQWAKRPQGWRIIRVERAGKDDLGSWQSP